MTALTDEPAAAAAAKPTSAAPGGGLGRYILVRFLLIFPTVLILVSLVFFLMRVVGDPITASVGGRLTEAQLAERLAAAGYDRPVLVQYVEYLKEIFTGDFGRTVTDNREISEILLTYGAATFELVTFALVIALVIGIPLGRIAAYRRDRWSDATLRVLAILAYATPVFFAGILLKLVFSVQLGWLPLGRRSSPQTQLILDRIDGSTGINIIDALRTGRWDLISDVLSHAVLPAVALGLLTAGVFLRLVRTNLIGTLSRRVRGPAPAQARVQARPHPDHHSDGHADRAHARWRDPHGDHVRVAWPGLPARAVPGRTRLRRGPGDRRAARGDRRGDQLRRRRRRRAHRPESEVLTWLRSLWA